MLARRSSSQGNPRIAVPATDARRHERRPLKPTNSIGLHFGSFEDLKQGRRHRNGNLNEVEHAGAVGAEAARPILPIAPAGRH